MMLTSRNIDQSGQCASSSSRTKSTIGVHGVDLSDDPRNNAVFGVLTLLVVLPALGAAAVWVWSLGGRRAS